MEVVLTNTGTTLGSLLREQRERARGGEVAGGGGERGYIKG